MTNSISNLVCAHELAKSKRIYRRVYKCGVWRSEMAHNVQLEHVIAYLAASLTAARGGFYTKYRGADLAASI